MRKSCSPLLSGIGQPYDPATGKGTLGKNLTHQVCAGLQLFFDRPLNGFMGAEGPISAFGRMPPGEVKTGWGSDWKKAALHWYGRMGSIMFEGDHFTYRHNYMDLDPGYKDKFGDPLLRMTLDWTDHERSQEQFFLKIQRELAADTRLRIIKAATCKAARS